MRPNTLGVVGLGAVGGSVAWHATQAGVKRVVGHPLAPRHGVAAVKVGAVTEIEADVERVVRISDVIVVALPPFATVEFLERLASVLMDRPGYCTDVSGVKAPVMRRAAELDLDRHFAGSHPLVGFTGAGFDSARPDVLNGRIVYVSPLPGGEVAAAEIADFWRRVVGAEPVMIDAEDHDKTMAWTSHVPQIVASALAATLARQGPRGLTYGAEALATTKAAWTDSEVWEDILLLNKGNVLSALDAVLFETERLMVDVEAGKGARLRDWFETGCRWRKQLGE